MSITVRETEAPQVIPREVEEAVRRGAELLDERHPGWAHKIDTDRLDISSGCNCIIGQLDPSVWCSASSPVTDWAEALGFYDRTRRSYPDLDRAWLVEIMERRSA
jgi:hypothetical protein